MYMSVNLSWLRYSEPRFRIYKTVVETAFVS